MKRFDHENIVKLLGVTTRGEPAYAIMEFMLFGNYWPSVIMVCNWPTEFNFNAPSTHLSIPSGYKTTSKTF